MDYRLAQVLRVAIIILSILLAIGLFVAGFVYLRSLLNRGPETPRQVTSKMSEYASSGATVSFVQDGIIDAPETHQTIVISVSPSSRTVSIIKGYNVPPTINKAFSNSEASYSAFMSALAGAGYSSSKSASAGANRAEVCPLGEKFSYKVILNTTTAQDTWNDDCDPRQGTFAGDSNLVQELFELQIPDYDDIVDSIN